MRYPRYRAAQFADHDHLAWPMYTGQNAAYASPWVHPVAPSPTWQHPTQLSPGIHWGSHQWDYTLAGGHANVSSRATMAGLPIAGNPSAYDSSEAPQTGTSGADREASATVARLRAAPARDAGPATLRSGVPHPLPPSHEALPLWRSPAIPATWTQQCVHWTPRTPSQSATARPLTARDRRLRSTPLPPCLIRTHASGHPPRGTRKGSIPSLSLQWRRRETTPFPWSST